MISHEISQVIAQVDCPVICDFRRNDLALGGQGAPLAPVFHQYLFDLTPNCIVLNLGGIANISYLTRSGTACGFDTGPANCLMDQYCQIYLDQPFDKEGELASQGVIDQTLLAKLKSHAYFSKIPPKLR